MKAQYGILRFKKYKGPAISPIEAHNERTKDQYASNPDIDVSRSRYNLHLVQPQGRYREEADRMIAAAHCRVRKDSVRVVEALVTASPEFFKDKTNREIKAYFEYVQPIPSNSQHHDTPNNKTHVIKFRVTAEEKASLELTCKLLNLSLSTFIRRAIHNVKIEKTIIVAGGGEETLTAVSTLLAQCSKVGSNLNQLFNSGGADTEQIRAKLLDELADLTAFRLSAEKVLGELYGNAQAYRL